MPVIPRLSGHPFRGTPIVYKDHFLGAGFGNHFWVDSGDANASDSPGAGSPNKPFSTIDYAVGQCTANNGDVIHVLPGHTETVAAAAGLDLDVAGITLLGYGSGSDRPTINFTATGSDVDVDAANVTMYNFLFTGGVDAVTAALDVNAADFKLLACEWRDVTGQVTDFLVTDAAADRLRVEGLFYQGSLTAGSAASGTSSAIVLVGCDRPVIKDCTFIGRFGIAAIECRTTAVVMARIKDCDFVLLDNRAVGTAGTAVEDIVTGSTGLIGPNLSIHQQTHGANITEAVTGATFRIIGPGVEVVNLDNEKSLEINWAETTDA